MENDKEITKEQIDELYRLSQEEDEEFIYEGYEKEIAKLVIDYSVRNSIIIPLIDYEMYLRIYDDEGSEEPYDYYGPFLEAIGEESLINPKFALHPDIKDLVSCWKIG